MHTFIGTPTPYRWSNCNRTNFLYKVLQTESHNHQWKSPLTFIHKNHFQAAILHWSCCWCVILCCESVFCVVGVITLQFGSHSKIKNKIKKNFFRPTDPTSGRASMDKQTIFFIWPYLQLKSLPEYKAVICQDLSGLFVCLFL